MRTAFRALAVAGLLLVIVPPVIFYADLGQSSIMKLLMLIGTACWFLGSYLGFRPDPDQRDLEEEHTPVA